MLLICGKILAFSSQKHNFKVVLVSYDKLNLAPVLLKLNMLRKSDKMLCTASHFISIP